MKRFLIVFAQEFREAVRSKPFIIISVFLLILLVGLAVAGVLMTGAIDNVTADQGYVDYTEDGSAAIETDEGFYIYSVAVCDRTGDDTLERLREKLPMHHFVPMELEENEIEQMLTDGYDAYVILESPEHFEIYEPADIYGASLGEDIRQALNDIRRGDMLAALGVDAQQAQNALEYDGAWYTQYAVGGFDTGEYIYNYVMVILMFMVIALYGQMVATRVATEKSSRTMEVLATSISPVELLCGKVMGVGAASLLQMGAFIGCAAALLRGLLSRSAVLSIVAAQVLSISGFDIACMVLYFVLGFLVYAFIFGALGSMVSQLEDLSGVVSLPMYLFMIGYFISIFSSVAGGSGILMKIASFVPFWSPVTMFARMTAEEVPVIELVISLTLLVVTAALTAWLSARIYRSGMLRYGKPPKFKEIINAAKAGK